MNIEAQVVHTWGVGHISHATSARSAERLSSMADDVTKLADHQFTCLVVGISRDNPQIGRVVLARPGKGNAFGEELWEEFPKALQALDDAASTLGVRVVVVSGLGRNFCVGIDLEYLRSMFQKLHQVSCPGRMREQFRRHIMKMQDCFTALERCRLPVIAAVHGHCVGAGVDLITACDIRVCSSDAKFCVKEVDLGIVADMGTLQRLPYVIGHGPATELALTARSVSANEALQLLLVSQVSPESGPSQVLQAALSLAANLAAKSPLALTGTKAVMLRMRGSCTVADSLDYVATWNSAQLVSEDVEAVLKALSGRGVRPPVFSKL